MTTQEFDVLVDLLHYSFPVLILEAEYEFILAQIEQIHILQAARRLHFIGLDFSIDDAALQIKGLVHELATLCRIRHEQDVYRHDVLHLHSEHTIDSGHKRVGVLYEVRQVLGQHGDEDVFFVVVHGFEQEFPVVGKEKEGA